jgi:uncharacterized protein
MTDNKHVFEVAMGRILDVSPGLPTTDMARTVDAYQRLGFTFGAPGSESVTDAVFAIAARDGIALHFALKQDHDPARTATWIYLGVDDADEIYAEFTAAKVDIRQPPHDTDYKMRELAYIDPDGNLLLFGSRKREPTLVSGPAGEPPDAAKAIDLADDPRLFAYASALRRGDADEVAAFLTSDPTLATTVINSRWPLHFYADAPGHRPNAHAIVSSLVEAGADLDAHALDTWHHETALHWAASNDDVELIDALLDAGADIEHPGSSIGGGPPAQSALGYTQWNALRRLYERGAKIGLSHAAALGLMPLVTSLTEAGPPSDEELTIAFWNACRAGQLESARVLLAHGADRDWPAPWSGQTPLDAAQDQHHGHVVAWLITTGARQGPSPEPPT